MLVEHFQSEQQQKSKLFFATIRFVFSVATTSLRIPQMQRVIHLLDVRVNVNHTYTVHMLVMLLTAVTAHSWGQQLSDTAVETFSSVSFQR